MSVRATDLRRLLAAAVAALALALPASGAGAADALAERANRGLVEIIAGSAGDSSLRMVEDLAEVLDDGATRRVLPVVGKGAFQNLADLRVLRGVDLAIVQTDVLDQARAQKLSPTIDGVTYIAKLGNDEFHLLARGDIASIGDLAGKKVNFGTPSDGAAFTGPRLFDLLGIQVEPTGFGQALALEKLRRGEIAAMAVVVGKPAPLFAAVRPQDHLHFLAVPLKGGLAAVLSAGAARQRGISRPRAAGRRGSTRSRSAPCWSSPALLPRPSAIATWRISSRPFSPSFPSCSRRRIIRNGRR